jgi:hypothetical protein
VYGNKSFANYFFREKILDKLNPNWNSPLDQRLVVSVIKERSFIPVELEKCN